MYLGNTPTQQAFTPAVDIFSGNGSTTAFTLSRPVASVAQVEAVIENVVQSPVDAYTISGNTITFTSAPPSGSSNIYVKYTSPITQVFTPNYRSVLPSALSSGGPSWDIYGSMSIAGDFTNGTGRTIAGGSGGNVLAYNGINTDFVSSGRTAAITGGWGTVRIHQAAGYRGLAIVGDTSQTAPYLDVESSTGATVARIDSSGNLLVGNSAQPNTGWVANARQYIEHTTAADYALHIRHSSATATNNYGIAVSYGASPNNTGNSFLDARDATTTRAQIRSNGGFANYSANNVNLSDVRTKTDIVDAGDYLAKICAIPVRTFKYKDQTDDLLNLGVIAQEVEAVAPELVDVSGFGETPEDGVPLKAIYQTDFQYALMKCIQEQQAIITSLTERITALENK